MSIELIATNNPEAAVVVTIFDNTGKVSQELSIDEAVRLADAVDAAIAAHYGATRPEPEQSFLEGPVCE